MLTNPYPHRIDSSEGDAKLQVDVDASDKSLLMSIRPVKGTTQLVVSNLIKNLCDDLRQLGILGYHIHGDAILEALVQRRPIPLDLFRCTALGTAPEVPKGLFKSGGRAEIREGLADASSKRSHDAGRTKQREHQPRGKSGKTTKGQQQETGASQ